MVQAWLVLVVAGVRVLWLGGADRQPGLAANEVEDPALGGVAFQIVLAVHLEVLAQRAIERTAARQIRDRELHVGDPCELHGCTIASARCHGKGSRTDRGRSCSVTACRNTASRRSLFATDLGPLLGRYKGEERTWRGNRSNVERWGNRPAACG